MSDTKPNATLVQELAAAQEQAELLGDRDTARLLERAAARVAELEADARRWQFWRLQWPALCRMEVARWAKLDLRTTYVQSPADMDKVTDAAMAPPQEQTP